MTDLNLADLDRRARDMLGRFPLIDGHNDLPWALRDRARAHGGHVSQVVFDLEAPAGGLHTDLPRLAAGGIAAVCPRRDHARRSGQRPVPADGEWRT